MPVVGGLLLKEYSAQRSKFGRLRPVLRLARGLARIGYPSFTLAKVGGMAAVVVLPERRVAYTFSFGHPSTSDAFARLEQVVPLKGNRFYATFEPRTQEYRACAALKDGERGSTYGLPEGLLAGGTYASTKLKGAFAEIVRSIGPAFECLRQEYKEDPRRLSIEYYKRDTEVILYLPIE